MKGEMDDHKIKVLKEKNYPHQGSKTRRAQRKLVRENSQINSELEKEKESTQEEKKVGIYDTLERVLNFDTKETKLPNLLKYSEWIYKALSGERLLNFKEEVNERVVRKARGAGGQNVQKNAAFVSTTHKYTGLRLELETERSLEQNKAVVLKNLEVLVDEHLNQWKGLVDSGVNLGDGLALTIKEVLDEKLAEMGDTKVIEFERIVGILKNKKNKTSQ